MTSKYLRQLVETAGDMLIKQHSREILTIENERDMAQQKLSDAISIIAYKDKKIQELELLNQWQPIETAPKDGKEFLAWSYYENKLVILKYDKDFDAFRDENSNFHKTYYWLKAPNQPC